MRKKVGIGWLSTLHPALDGKPWLRQVARRLYGGEIFSEIYPAMVYKEIIADLEKIATIINELHDEKPLQAGEVKKFLKTMGERERNASL